MSILGTLVGTDDAADGYWRITFNQEGNGPVTLYVIGYQAGYSGSINDVIAAMRDGIAANLEDVSSVVAARESSTYSTL